MDEAEDEANPREFGGEVDAMSKIHRKKQHIISKMYKMKVADSLCVGRKSATYSGL